jgi:hypothetical protein
MAREENQCFWMTCWVWSRCCSWWVGVAHAVVSMCLLHQRNRTGGRG